MSAATRRCSPSELGPPHEDDADEHQETDKGEHNDDRWKTS